MNDRTADRRRLPGTLLLAWCAGLVSAPGIGIVRATVSSVVPGGGGIAGIVLLAGVGFGFMLQAPAFGAMWAVVGRHRGTRQGAEGAALGVLALGGAGMIVLNLILVSGPYLPPFGPVSTVLLCLPYPLAFALWEIRRRTVVAGAGALVLLLAGCVVPLHALQERLAVRTWLSRHPGLDRALLQGVTWPGGERAPFTTGPYGVRTTVYFRDSTIDGNDEVVTVAPTATDPCGSAAAIATTDNAARDDEHLTGTVISLPVTGCTPDGNDAWALRGHDFTGYALRRNGALVTVCVDTYRTQDDLSAIARTLHPLDDHALWPYLSLDWSRTWLVM